MEVAAQSGTIFFIPRLNPVSLSAIEMEVIGEFKKLVPSLLSFPFECLDMLGRVNLEAGCQKWQSQRMEGEQVRGSWLG